MKKYTMPKRTLLPCTIAIIFLLLPLFSYSQSSRYPPKEENGKWGIWNDYNNKCWVYDPVYDLVEQFDGYYKTYEGELVGLITNNYIVPLEPQFEDIYYEESTSLIAVRKNGKWGRINEKREVLIDYAYDDLKSIGKSLLKISRGQKYGLIDYQGNEIAPAEFEEITSNPKENPYREKILNVFKDKKTGIIDLNGNFWLPCEFEKVSPSLFISEKLSKPNLFPVSKDNKWGFANGKGELIVPYTYAEVSPFHKGVAIVAFEPGAFGLINEKGEVITNQKYSKIDGFDPITDVSQVSVTSKEIGLISLDGKEVLAPGGYTIKPFYENPAIVSEREREEERRREKRGRGGRTRAMKDSEKGHDDIRRDELAFGLYSYTYRKKTVKEEPGKRPARFTGLISADGKIDIPPAAYRNYRTFRYGILNATKDLSLINQKKILPKKFNSATYLYKNYLIVGKAAQYGIYDVLKKKLIVPLEYDHILGVQGPLAHFRENCQADFFVVTKNKKVGLVNKSNQLVIPVEYSQLELSTTYGVAIVRKSKKLPDLKEGNHIRMNRQEHQFALFNLAGEQLTDFEYDGIQNFHHAIAVVVKNGKPGCINSKGEEFIPCGKFPAIRMFRPYSKEVGFHNLHQSGNNCSAPELPDGLQLRSYFSKDTMHYLIDLKGEIVDSVSLRKGFGTTSSHRWEKEMVFRNGKYEIKYRRPFGQDQYGSNIVPEKLAQFSEETGGFHVIGESSKQLRGYYFQQTGVSRLFDEVELRGDPKVPIRWVKEGKYYGFINNLGELVTPIHFEKIGSLADGLICVVKDGKVGYLNQAGEQIIPFDFEDDYNKIPQFNFQNGKAVALLNKKYGVINKKGEVLVPFQFDGILYYDGLEVLGIVGGKWRVVKI